MPGSGSLWRLAPGEDRGTIHNGSQADYDALKALLAPTGGMIQVGPGLEEALVYGVNSGNIVTVGVSKFGELIIGGLYIADVVDPTRRLLVACDGIGAGVTRIAVAPNWSGLLLLPSTLGSADDFLRSGGAGVQPAFASIAQALLGGRHTDTVGAAPTRGGIIVGNSTPAWVLKALGAADTFLGSDGTDLVYRTVAAVAAVLQHDLLLHIRPFQVADCNIANGSNRLNTNAANGFANVRVGDFVRFDVMTTSVWGARVTALVDSDSVDLDLTNTGSSQTGRLATFTPGDHWDDTIGTGYMLACGRGTYDAAATPGGTFQLVRGSFDFEGYEGGHAPLMGWWGSTSTVTPFGFNIKKPGTGSRVYIHVNDITGGIVLRVGNPASGSFFMYQSGSSQAIIDSSGLSATRSLIARDYAGTLAVEGAVTALTGATPSVAGGRTFKVSNIGATNMTDLTGGYDGLEVNLLFTNGNTTVKDTSTTGSFELLGGLDFNALANTVMKFVRVNADSKWYEISRSVN